MSTKKTTDHPDRPHRGRKNGTIHYALAKAVGGEIISADSMQVYRHMDIGSAKIRPEEMEGVPHHLIDVLEPEEEFHVVRVSADGQRGH